MKKISISFVLLMFAAIASYGQNPYKGEIKVIFGEISRNEEKITLEAEVDLSALKLGSNNMITFTPVFTSADSTEKITFAPVTVSGEKRAKYIRREQYYLRQATDLEETLRVVDKKTRGVKIPLHYSIPFQEWMRNSQMIVVEEISGCCDDLQVYTDGNRYKIHQGPHIRFREPYEPVFSISYLPAPKTDSKIMNETYSAQLNFQSGKSLLLRQFGNNERNLNEVDKIITQFKNDSLLTIRRIMVYGYASPEGNTANNLKLSKERAQAFVAYIHFNHHFYEADNIITSYGHGEDWSGLRKAVEKYPHFNDKERVLNIIDNIYAPQQRKAALKSLSGGRTYSMLLNELFPPLRRNEYTIEYEVRGFSAKEGAEIFQTRPQLLSLEELFMVANLYEHDLEKYKQAFDVAARLFPDSHVAQFNVSAMEIENGSYDTAIKRLKNFDTHEAFNNLGIAYWYKQEYDKAKVFLQRAADFGNPEADYNLSEFEKWAEMGNLRE